MMAALGFFSARSDTVGERGNECLFFMPVGTAMEEGSGMFFFFSFFTKRQQVNATCTK